MRKAVGPSWLCMLSSGKEGHHKDAAPQMRIAALLYSKGCCMMFTAGRAMQSQRMNTGISLAVSLKLEHAASVLVSVQGMLCMTLPKE